MTVNADPNDPLVGQSNSDSLSGASYSALCRRWGSCGVVRRRCDLRWSGISIGRGISFGSEPSMCLVRDHPFDALSIGQASALVGVSGANVIVEVARESTSEFPGARPQGANKDQPPPRLPPTPCSSLVCFVRSGSIGRAPSVGRRRSGSSGRIILSHRMTQCADLTPNGRTMAHSIW